MAKSPFPLKPGEGLRAAGVVLACVGLLFVGLVLGVSRPRYEALKARGLVAQARVRGKEIEERSGRRSRSANYYVEVAFDPKQGRPFAAGPEPAVPTPLPLAGSKIDPIARLQFAFTGGASPGSATARLNMPYERFEALKSGDPLPVVFLPESPAEALAYDHVVAYTAAPMLALAIFLALFGAILGAIGHHRMGETKAPA